MKATRLLKLLPSLRDCLVSLSWVAQGMVAVMRTGLRNASGTTKSRLPCENAVISSIHSWTGHGSGGCRLAGPPKLQHSGSGYVKSAVTLPHITAKISEALYRDSGAALPPCRGGRMCTRSCVEYARTTYSARSSLRTLGSQQQLAIDSQQFRLNEN